MKEKLDPEVLKLVESYLERLSKRVNLKEAYLFGSFAKGEQLEESDIDLVLVSPDFEGMPLSRRIKIVYEPWPLEKYSADLIPLGDKEFERKKRTSIVLRDAQKYWVRVFPR